MGADSGGSRGSGAAGDLPLDRGEPENRQRLMGRLASLLFLGSGLVATVVLPIRPPDLNRPVTLLVTSLALAIGVFAWIAPWDRWPRRASLVLVPPAFALIAVGNVYGGSSLHTYGIFFVVAFAWIGVAHAPWTSVWMAPLAALAFILPLPHLPGDFGSGLSAAALTIPVCVLVGESLARGAQRLATTEEALRRQREVAERLRALDEIKDRVMSAISHELRTPITISRGHLELLGARPDPREVKEAVDLVVDELDRMGRIVNDMKTLVRMEDPEALERRFVPLGRFLRDLAAKAEPLLGERVRLGGLPADGVGVVADPHRLTQALLNLLDNAAVHGGDGDVELSLAEEDGHWRFDVADDGGGLPAGEEERLFSAFRTGPSSSGTGLGLAIVRAIVEAHGGSVGVDNRPGEGARFWVRIPK